jgi:RHS repeat-associated protein
LGSVRQLTGKRICPIATAVYGTPLAEEVRVLSRLRDEYLLTNEWGERLVAFYYRHSPRVADFIQDNRWTQPFLRLALWPVVRIATLIVGEKDTSSGSGNPNPSPRQRDFRRVPIEEEYTYCAFGNLIEGNNHNNPYGFAGEQQFREAAGLIFLRARYYDPSVGRFVSKDPILKPMIRRGHRRWMLPHIVRFPQMLHPYVYVANNPVNYVDPTGKMPWKLILALIGTGAAIEHIDDVVRCITALQILDAKMDEVFAEIKAMPECTVEQILEKEEARRAASARARYLPEYEIAVKKCGGWVVGWYTAGPIKPRL